MPNSLNPIQNSSTIVIIGGGPAGSSCAIKLRQLSQKMGKNLRVVVYEGKRFDKKSYYNQCLGVLSPPIDKILEEQLHVSFPMDIVHKKIEGYHLHTTNNVLHLEGENDPSFACRRVEFDNYLFEKAKEAGAEVVQARVTELDFADDSVMVFSESNNIKADVVVGAFGLDDGLAKAFERLTPYRQSDFLFSVVTKIHPGQEKVQEFGNYIHAFLPSSLPRVEFGAITPKGNHLAINIAGKTVDANMMHRFLNLPNVRSVLPDNVEEILPSLLYFKGKFPTLPAKGIIGNRYIMVGDTAGLNRPFKGKGINSAVFTGIKAAEVIVKNGFLKESFHEYLDSCKELTDDIPYGKVLRFATNICSRLGFLDSVCKTAQDEPQIKKAFFNIVSGQETYKKTWKETRSLRLFFKLGVNAIKSKSKKKQGK